MSGFDFEGFRAAFEGKQLDRWLGFYAEDAEWIEYKPTAPPRSPVVMAGRAAIADFLTGIAASPIELEISDQVVGERRCAFRVTAGLPDGRRVIEHVIAEIADGRIVRQVDVEAWD